MPLSVDADRLWSSVVALGSIGETNEGGLTRIGYSPEERAAKDYVAGRLEAIGFVVHYDLAGNLIGRREGYEALPALVAGSHVDTVPNGGRFDGALGVLAALEAFETLVMGDYAHRHPLELIAFADEEGARFGRGLTGSRLLTGTLDLEAWSGLADFKGLPIRDVFAAAGAYFDLAVTEARRQESIAAYLELHIEQAQVLEDMNLPVGIVTGIVGINRFQLVFTGRADHAGATPMDLRRDALVCTARFIADVTDLAAAEGRPIVATVGRLEVQPNVANIVPSRVTCTLEVRGLALEHLDAVCEKALGLAAQHAEQQGVDLSVTPTVRTLPVLMDETIQSVFAQACEQAGLSPYRLSSGGGHDAMLMASLAPTGMLFVRCRDGISHNPLEYVTPEDCATGAQVLLNTLMLLDQQ